jgi:hypothetical protein
MVSWVTPSQRGDGMYTIGVLVFGMDKLDSGGVNLSRAPQLSSYSLAPTDPTSESRLSMPEPPRESEPLGRRLRDSEPAPAWTKLVRDKGEPPPRFSPPPRSGSARGALVSMCAVDLKIARWMATAAERPVLDEPAVREPTLHELRAALEAQGKAAPTRPPGSPFGPSAASTKPAESSPLPKAGGIAPQRPSVSRSSQQSAQGAAMADKDALPVQMAAAAPGGPDPLASTMMAPRRPSRPRPLGRRTSEIPVIAEEMRPEPLVEYDAEERTIEAFEKIHGLYGCKDRESAAEFVLGLACKLVRCEAAACWLIAEKTPRLEAVAAQGTLLSKIEGTKIELGAGLPGKSVREGRLIRSESASDLAPYSGPPYPPSGFRGPVRSALVAPVMHDGHTVGAIELLSSQRTGGFVQGEANVLLYLSVALAEHMGSALPLREEG